MSFLGSASSVLLESVNTLDLGALVSSYTHAKKLEDEGKLDQLTHSNVSNKLGNADSEEFDFFPEEDSAKPSGSAPAKPKVKRASKPKAAVRTTKSHRGVKLNLKRRYGSTQRTATRRARKDHFKKVVASERGRS
ncbi:hypothetical protein J8273_4445 [Carpediemonas membranifera]|uniref:Uncharacterized protein n=1 Tax=Carpediemonas membranifera TaxID=201153 RepID=A0A8J6B6Y2_9EUKA|nr:hypothetical protein J8273_4445 [Carpediemonas membranifera]|eukprot:KAG9394082.1 hypothetical protein J8273_4445 [Carpediemonas membranifera]